MLLIKSATILDTRSKHHRKQRDLLIKDGKIEQIRVKINAPKAKVMNAAGAFVSIGWLDVGVQTNDPGYEHREDLQTVSAAAAAGGYTGLATFPNTHPPVHSKSEVLYLKNNAKENLVDFYPIGAVSHNCEGVDITEMYDMHHAGAVAFSDGQKPIQNSGLMMRALQYVKAFDGTILNHPHNKNVAGSGQMHEGKISTSLGMKGIASIAEELMVQRDIYLAEYTDSKLHVNNISSVTSEALVRSAKQKGLKVTASVAILNLIFSDEELADFNTNFKIMPPLREKKDIEALRAGLQNGTIDIITSNHVPVEAEGKNLEFLNAYFGALGLQTTYALYNTHLTNVISVENFVEKVAIHPRQLLHIELPEIAQNAPANLTIFDPNEEWTFSEKDILSKSKNSPMVGMQLRGKVLGVVNNGQVRVF
ncbi:MAG: dihydroorotase [Bacteroidota bacterium]